MSPKLPYRMICLFVVACITLFVIGCSQSYKAYDEELDANIAVEKALKTAKQTDKKVILIFGANWCTDCRVFDQALEQDTVQAQLKESFEVVKIDIGDFDKHKALVAQYGDITSNGIPTLVVVNGDNQEILATRKGELRTARHLSEEDLSAFFKSLADLI